MGDEQAWAGGEEAWREAAAPDAGMFPSGPDIVLGESHANSTARVSISDVSARSVVGHGIPFIQASLRITNHSGRALAADELILVVSAYPQSGQAEQHASLMLPIGALPDGHDDTYPTILEVDPGDWLFYAMVTPRTDMGMPVQDITAVPVTVAGPTLERPAHNEAPADIAVEITGVVRQAGAFYRVHYVVDNHSAAVKPGFAVRGHLWSEDGNYFAEQIYTLTQPLPHGRSSDHYLTLEGTPNEKGMWARIKVDADTPSEAHATVRVHRDGHGVVTAIEPADPPPIP